MRGEPEETERDEGETGIQRREVERQETTAKDRVPPQVPGDVPGGSRERERREREVRTWRRMRCSAAPCMAARRSMR